MLQLLTIDWTDDGTLVASSYSSDGVTVSGSNDINVLSFNGLGIVGGVVDNGLDFGESMTFTFDLGLVTNVNYSVHSLSNTDFETHPEVNGERNIEIFGINNTSLGVFNTTGVDGSVSKFVSNQAISSFTISMLHDTTRITQLSYDVSTVPVPAAVWLFGSGLLVLVGMARRKKA